MTAIAQRKTRLRFETGATVKGRPLLVEVDPYGLIIRPKGLRYGYSVPWSAVHDLGAKLAAREAKDQ